MSQPHRLDIFKHGHGALCSGVLICSFLDILEVRAGFEGVQDWAAEQLGCRAVVSVGNVDESATEGPQTATKSAGYWLAI